MTLFHRSHRVQLRIALTLTARVDATGLHGWQTLLQFHMYTCIAVLKELEEELIDLEHDEAKAMLRQLPPLDIPSIVLQATYIQEEVETSHLFDDS